MKIKKFNESLTDVGLNELIEDIKNDPKVSEFEVKGDTFDGCWRIKFYSGGFFNRSIGDVINLQLILSTKIVEISKYYDILNSEIRIYKKSGYILSADVCLK